MGLFSWMLAGGAAGAAKAAGEVASENIAETKKRALLAETDKLARGRTEHAQELRDKSAISLLGEQEKIQQAATTEARKYAKENMPAELVAYDKNKDVFLTQKELNERTDMKGVIPKDLVGSKNASKNGKWVQDKGGMWQFLTKERSGKVEGLLKDGPGARDASKNAKDANKYFEKLVTEFSNEGKKIPESSLILLNEMRSLAGMGPVSNKLDKEGWFEWGNKYGIKIGKAEDAKRDPASALDDILFKYQRGGQVAPAKKSRRMSPAATPSHRPVAPLSQREIQRRLEEKRGSGL